MLDLTGMPMITIRQPWATCLAYAAVTPKGKPVENRGKPDPWRSAIGKRVGFHAGKTWDADALSFGPFFDLADGTRPGGVGPLLGWMIPDFHVRGAVIATAVLKDVHFCDGSCSPWADPTQWHLVWTDVQILPEPVPAKGMLGLWTLPAGVVA